MTESTLKDLTGKLVHSFWSHPYTDHFRATRAKLWYWRKFRPDRYAMLRWINLGSGPSPFPGVCNIDLTGPAELHFNFLNRFPLADRVSEAVYSEHVLEHFHIDQVPHLLREVRRILVPGGVFRVSVPGVDIPENRPWTVGRPRIWRVDEFDAPTMEALSRGLFNHDHHALYSLTLLEHLLRTAGFSDVRTAKEGEAVWFPSELLRRVEHRKVGNLIVEALK